MVHRGEQVGVNVGLAGLGAARGDADGLKDPLQAIRQGGILDGQGNAGQVLHLGQALQLLFHGPAVNEVQLLLVDGHAQVLHPGQNGKTFRLQLKNAVQLLCREKRSLQSEHFEGEANVLDGIRRHKPRRNMRHPPFWGNPILPGRFVQ